ncbi:Nn.00g031330.m01.CDS01 [Neocucurbitaria sp. VM-36]
MPIFHDLHESPPRRSSSRQASSAGLQRAGISGFGLERPLIDSFQIAEGTDPSLSFDMDPESPNQGRKPSMFDRIELIERLKRSNSPLWQQRQTNSTPSRDQSPGPRPISRDCTPNPLLPSAEIKPLRTSTPEPLRDLATAGLEIERPRSALHSGDFREKKEGSGPDNVASSSGFLATSPVAPWNRSFPAPAYPLKQEEASYSFHEIPSNDVRPVSRARAISQSSLHSFAFLPPTSPLVQEANNTDLDFSSRPNSRQSSRSPERTNRRHTYSPASFHGYQSTSMAGSASGTPAARHLRYGGSIPYQAHQPRRASTFNQMQPQSNPPTPFLASRRPSFSSEASPLHHAPMVGSYEESILRGRMSTTPSRPLNFVAKIGVLGKGQCKSSLKCPPHVAVPFPAVFYSYNTGNGRISDNEPSPYVGLIDLENSLPPPEDSNESSRRRRRHAVPPPDNDDLDFRLHFGEEDIDRSAKEDLRRKEKRKRRSASPKAPPGGSYRIPPQGQLQIVLKNPNKTAVKLFLVPYDLSDMEPGQKTFIRQRSYSAGPIIDMPASSRTNLGTDRPEAALSNSDDPNDRPILRYLIHLHICCPSKGRHYLYKSIRVVFANRVPDGKEKLRNEIQLPEPRYSAYKPTRDSIASQNTTSAGAQLTAEKAFRRRSAGWPLSRSQQAYDQIDGLRQYSELPPPAVQFTGGPLASSASSGFSSPVPDLQPIPFSLTRLSAIESRPVSRDYMDIDAKSPFKTPVASPKSSAGIPGSHREGTFEKLNKGDVGYGGSAFSPISSPTSPPSAGLLSQRLRGLDVQREADME